MPDRPGQLGAAKLLQIKARGEGWPGAGDYDRPDALVVVPRGELIGQLVTEGDRKRVSLLGPVQGQDGDAIAHDLGGDAGLGHPLTLPEVRTPPDAHRIRYVSPAVSRLAGAGDIKRGAAGARRAAVVALAVVALFAVGSPAHAQASTPRDPVIFVHGYVGSGAQFESQKMRFVENGYPDSFVRVLEYDSSPATPVPGGTGLNPAGIKVIEAQLFPRLDQLIAHLKTETGRPQVELVAHSLGTTLMQDYLNSDPARAANVAHYANIDGRTATSPPGGVPTLALWATKGPLSPPGRSITGATNVTVPDSTHVQAATSAFSFGEMYEFFNNG